MSDVSDVPQPAPLSLDSFSEALRRRLYDRVVQIQFSSAEPRLPYTPDQAALQIVCTRAAVAAHLRTQIVRIQVSPADPAEIVLDAV